MTLVKANCSDGAGWDYKTPPLCKKNGLFEGNIMKSSCMIDNGEYYVNHLKLIRQMPNTGTNFVKIGIRSGCAGVQTNCNVKVQFAKAPDEENCENAAWDDNNTITFNNLDYEYIFSDPIYIGQYINNNPKATNKYHWCMKITSQECSINSILIDKSIET